MLLFLLLLTVASAQSPGTFFNPPAAVNDQTGFQSNPVWTIGDTQSIQWTITFSNYTIELWQQVLGQGIALQGPSIFQTQAGAVTQFNWIVQTFQFDLKSSNVFLLWILPGANGDGSGPSVTSHYFNITATSSSSITSSLSVAPRSSNTMSIFTSPSFSTTATAPPTTSTSVDSNHPSELTTGAKVGIGLGALFGFALGAAVCVLTMWCLRRRKSQGPREQALDAQSRKNPGTVQVETLPHNSHPVEVESVRYPVELG